MAAFDPDTGELLWHRYIISDADSQSGAAGGGVWGTPTFDPDTGHLYIGTGQNYIEPATDTSDSVFALDVATLDLPARFAAADVFRAMHGHVLAEASTHGTYSLNG